MARRARFLVQWHGARGVTELLLVDRDQNIHLVGDLPSRAVLEDVATAHPYIPVDERPGAFRRTS